MLNMKKAIGYVCEKVSDTVFLFQISKFWVCRTSGWPKLSRLHSIISFYEDNFNLAFFRFKFAFTFLLATNLPNVHRYHAVRVRENISVNSNHKISHNYIISLILTLKILLAFLQKRPKLYPEAESGQESGIDGY
jgi:hypothetical protein